MPPLIGEGKTEERQAPTYICTICGSSRIILRDREWAGEGRGKVGLYRFSM